MKHSRFTAYFPTVIIGLGIVVRLFHYVSNRSLYTDEAYLANNLLTRDFAGLTQPLDTAQHAPLLFLWIEKLFLLIFGHSEYALRLFPLLAGIAALFFFRQLLAKFQTGLYGTLAGLLVFAFAHPLVYYSSEAKQYMIEVLCSIVLLLAYFHFKDRQSFSSLGWYALTGVLIAWLSYPAIFGLFTIAFVHGIELLRQKDTRRLGIFLPVYALWGASFLLNLLLIIIPNSLRSGEIQGMWTDAFAPFPPASAADLKWYFLTLFTVFDYPLGLSWSFLVPYVSVWLTFAFLPLLVIILGGWGLFRRSRAQLLLLTLPIVFTFFASAAGKYPFAERLLLFIVPYIFIVLSLGADKIGALLSARWPAVAWLAVALLAAAPVVTVVEDMIREKQFGGWKRREMKEAIAFLQTHKKLQEPLFINHIASAFPYYNRIYALRWPYQMLTIERMVPAGDTTLRQAIITKTRHTPFWIIVAGDSEPTGEGKALTHKQAFIHYFDTRFRKLQQFRAKGVYTAQYQ